MQARFAANYRSNICATTGFHWIYIFATRDIKAGSELFLDYGNDFWMGIQARGSPMPSRPTNQSAAQSTRKMTTPTTLTDTQTEPRSPNETNWAEPAVIPASLVTPNETSLGATTANTSRCCARPSSPPKLTSPQISSTPTILGHYTHEHTPTRHTHNQTYIYHSQFTHTPISISPIQKQQSDIDIQVENNRFTHTSYPNDLNQTIYI